MTEVPEHLLRRSRERRAALGLGGGEGGESAPAAADATPATTSAATPAPAAASAAPAVPAEPAFVEPVNRENYLRVQEYKRTRIPVWAMSGLLALPFWGALYFGAFGERGGHGEEGPPDGAAIYAGNCASCHGAAGEGGVGPAMSGGAVALTFPDPAAHTAWIEGGSASVGIGNPYGDPDREGGQRIARGGMPAFRGTLTAEEIDAVVAYERDEL